MLSPSLSANPHGVNAAIIWSVLIQHPPTPTPAPAFLQELPLPRGAGAGEAEGSFIAEGRTRKRRRVGGV